MKAVIEILLFYFLILYSASCSTTKYNIKKNHNFTKRTVSRLLEKNGNVFWLGADYATFSTIWTYRGDRINIYKLASVKIREQREYSNHGISNYQIPVSKELGLDIGTYCGFMLDGELFGFKIKRESEIQDFGIGIKIECLTENMFKSDFLNKIVFDITTYNLH